MPEISLCFNEKKFEYDVQTLLLAFYPGSEVKIWYREDGQPEGIFPIRAEVEYLENAVRFSCNERTEEIFLSAGEKRELAKNQLKRLVYGVLVKETGRELPWGDLTGIRPVKLAMRQLESGRTAEEAEAFLRTEYLVSSEKAQLAVCTAETEKELLNTLHIERPGEPEDRQKGYSLYVGIPFCPTICLYCSFGSHPYEQWKHLTEAYLDALLAELRWIASAMKDWVLDTIYIGGGTPTTLSPEQLDRLLGGITELFPIRQVKEWTVEAGRPDTITAEKLEVLRRYPVSRISVNPQTMNQKTLDLIGRKHTTEDIRTSFLLAREMGFDNINMDLIVGLPGEGEQEVAHTLREIAALMPDSLTVHSLALKRAARLSLFKEEFVPISFGNSSAIMRQTTDCAEALGMRPYYLYRQKNMAGNFENTGFARPAKEGLYNILIMEEKQTIMAAGSGASTKFVFEGGERIERAENVKNLQQYIDRLPEMLERKRDGLAKWLHQGI